MGEYINNEYGIDSEEWNRRCYSSDRILLTEEQFYHFCQQVFPLAIRLGYTVSLQPQYVFIPVGAPLWEGKAASASFKMETPPTCELEYLLQKEDSPSITALLRTCPGAHTGLKEGPDELRKWAVAAGFVDPLLQGTIHKRRFDLHVRYQDTIDEAAIALYNEIYVLLNKPFSGVSYDTYITIEKDRLLRANQLLLRVHLLEYESHAGEYIAFCVNADNSRTIRFGVAEESLRALLRKEFPGRHDMFAIRKLDDETLEQARIARFNIEQYIQMHEDFEEEE